MRAAMSVPPPAANGTITVIALPFSGNTAFGAEAAVGADVALGAAVSGDGLAAGFVAWIGAAASFDAAGAGLLCVQLTSNRLAAANAVARETKTRSSVLPFLFLAISRVPYVDALRSQRFL